MKERRGAAQENEEDEGRMARTANGQEMVRQPFVVFGQELQSNVTKDGKVVHADPVSPFSIGEPR